MDRALWRIERYREFLAARRTLLAAETNQRFAELLHGDPKWLAEAAPGTAEPAPVSPGGITSEAEERELEALNDWLETQDLPRGQLARIFHETRTAAFRFVL